ncbi:hypothetical protein LINGRAHAP2_LOCUS13029 [Linum grandiflorum]
MEQPPQLHRRSSIAAAAPSPDDVELYSFTKSTPSAYTSIKDLLPSAAVNSPTVAGAAGGAGVFSREISIRNRLVKQAAWAYLQPMSASPESSGHHFLHRLWLRFASLRHPVKACFRFFKLRLFPAVSRFFISIWA